MTKTMRRKMGWLQLLFDIFVNVLTAFRSTVLSDFYTERQTNTMAKYPLVYLR